MPTAVTGFYGQNLPYPGYQQWWGFLVSTLVTVTLAVGIWAIFRRKRLAVAQPATVSSTRWNSFTLE